MISSTIRSIRSAPPLFVSRASGAAARPTSAGPSAGTASPERSGAALSVQQTVLSLAAVATPIAFAAVVSVGSWMLAYGLAALFPLAGWIVLRPLRER